MTLSEIVPLAALLVPPASSAATGYKVASFSGAGVGLLIGIGLGVLGFFAARRLRLDGPAALLLFPWTIAVAIITALLLHTLFPHAPA